MANNLSDDQPIICCCYRLLLADRSRSDRALLHGRLSPLERLFPLPPRSTLARSLPSAAEPRVRAAHARASDTGATDEGAPRAGKRDRVQAPREAPLSRELDRWLAELALAGCSPRERESKKRYDRCERNKLPVVGLVSRGNRRWPRADGAAPSAAISWQQQ